ncbi:MAG TPA: zinc ribbon domain-containing protein [Anaerolineaceae bacterium]|nr:zinc ribbon domain-containing protein [Anaerolineaceae bacterium]HPN50112.1 zinc ribbon domain-containing protein [Anaerolineaceae bacterium]
MAEKIVFTGNYNDLSTDRGFQFEFICSRCSTGFRTPFKAWAIGNVSGVMDAASSIFGGLFSQAANLTERARSAGWQQARDAALEESLTAMHEDFIQCPRCSSWVCRQKCWNTKRGLCKNCAPDLGVEMSAAQASHSVQEIWAHAAMAEEDKKLAEGNWNETIRASCPECNTPLATNAKFCPNCGAKLKVAQHCTQCGAKLQPGAKFCAECGTKTGA